MIISASGWKREGLNDRASFQITISMSGEEMHLLQRDDAIGTIAKDRFSVSIMNAVLQEKQE